MHSSPDKGVTQKSNLARLQFNSVGFVFHFVVLVYGAPEITSWRVRFDSSHTVSIIIWFM